MPIEETGKSKDIKPLNNSTSNNKKGLSSVQYIFIFFSIIILLYTALLFYVPSTAKDKYFPLSKKEIKTSFLVDGTISSIRGICLIFSADKGVIGKTGNKCIVSMNDLQNRLHYLWYTRTKKHGLIEYSQWKDFVINSDKLIKKRQQIGYINYKKINYIKRKIFK